MSAFITALLPVLRTKIGSLLPKVANQPQLLSHLIHEIMSFDSTIRDTWAYDGGYGLSGWNGLSWEFLVQGNWFDQWLRVEKECMQLASEAHPNDMLTVEQLLLSVTTTSSKPKIGEISTTKASMPKPQNPQRAQSVSTTCSKR
jgi:hypothetical protein